MFKTKTPFPTQYYHLTHCPRHEPVAIQVWLLILVLAFNLFELFVRRHGKLWRAGRVTLQALARQLDRALEAVRDPRRCGVGERRLYREGCSLPMKNGWRDDRGGSVASAGVERARNPRQTTLAPGNN